MPEQQTPTPPVAAARMVGRRRTRPSLVWIVPALAALVGGWVTVVRILAQGPKITIVFRDAEGLEAGKTKILYRGVEVGILKAIRLTEDHRRVEATAEMQPGTSDVLLDDTQFWVVRPRISGANVSGIGTLISGAYIQMEIGTSPDHRREFVALEEPPVVTRDVPGRQFVLKSSDLGSLDTGTPIYFRRLQVGEVASYELDPDGHALTVRVFVKAPYDQYVTPNTRFWHASGIDVSLSAAGLDVQTQSLLSILIGGIAFATAPNEPVLPPAEPDTVFTLFGDRAAAFKLPARDPQTYTLVFNQSVRGLAAGAPVEFKGIPIGEVTDVQAQFDAETFDFSVRVSLQVDPTRMGVKVLDAPVAATSAEVHRQIIDGLVAQGVRAQLRSGNLLTGALYVAFDTFPHAAPVTLDWSHPPVQLPTQPGDLEAAEASVMSIVKKLDQLPLKAIGDDLHKAIVDLDRTLVSARGTLDNADRLIEPGSGLGQELGNTLDEVSRAARGLRVLLDYLERHPESLLRGKPGEGK